MLLFIQALCFALFWHPGLQAHADHGRPVAHIESLNWQPPVANAEPADLLRPFIAPQMPWSSAHRGIDIRASSPEIRAPAAGEVIFVGQVVDRGSLPFDMQMVCCLHLNRSNLN